MDKIKVLRCLESLALSKLNGDCLRIALFIAGTGKQVRLYEIEKALNLSKNNVSSYCRKLYKMNILKLYTATSGIGNKKLIYPHYSMNWDYKLEEVKGP